MRREAQYFSIIDVEPLAPHAAREFEVDSTDDVYYAEISNGEEIVFQAPARDRDATQLCDGQRAKPYKPPMVDDFVCVIDGEMTAIFTTTNDGKNRVFKRPAFELTADI